MAMYEKTIQEITTISGKLRDPIHFCLLFSVCFFYTRATTVLFYTGTDFSVDYLNICLTQACLFFISKVLGCSKIKLNLLKHHNHIA